MGKMVVNVFNTKDVSYWFLYMRVPKVLLFPQQLGFLAQKRPNFSDPFGAIPNLKTNMQLRCQVPSCSISIQYRNYPFLKFLSPLFSQSSVIPKYWKKQHANKTGTKIQNIQDDKRV